ncbi:MULTISPECIES: helix-hairpin-helix domain-containing protein [unclassified Streptomyces]|uniref:helix-hairpin-helix domain-containing protein n=1 Tax=unclassified Streptomyces TaxID=2593676 RepID=UPI00088A41A5|nr:MULTISPECIES: helix-hairpin-helix domain-containing protein [unclassified Streptomyces]PBC81499.1 UvrD-like helicase family protein [Streptomyces sp. 2321.6]SDR54685.1 UvrD-like helicase C-terminal domain-containing protein [Streptomyces sp. KS_16]SEC17816.1 UvrD-like helicase C-terminal domain-containing protein [Streptomyces sp. 2133.1]SNC65634.1 UvrD-like helicase C-terminal domain-containing protein [Streptomyces sp. 2114.4]
MSTDRLAGETPPEQEAAPGTADAQTPDDPTAPEDPTAPRNDAMAPGPDATAPEQATAPDTDTTTPEHATAPDTDTDTTAPEGSSAGAADATVPVSEPAPAASGAGDRAPGSGAARETAVPASGKATADALAAAVRAVESGERTAASFFNDTPRPAPRPTRQAAPAARPREDRPDTTGRAPQQGAPPGPAAPEAARPGTAPDAGRPAGPPVTDTGAMGPAAAPAPAGPAPAPRPSVATAPGIEGVRQVLTAGGAPQALAEPAAEVLGERAAEALREDPWQLLGVPGVRPEQADGFARALLGPACGPGDERRAQALVGWLLEQAAVAGHSALEAAALRAALAQRSVPDPDEALQTAIADGAVLVFQDAIEEPGRARPATGDDEDEEQPVRILLGLDRFAMAEESVADGLARLLNTFEAVAGPERHTAADAGEPGGDTAASKPTTAEPADADRSPAAEGAGAPAPDAGDTGAAADADDTAAPRPVRPSAAAWEAAAAAAPSPSAAELIRATAHSGLVAHTGAEAARAEPAALIAAARSLGLRAFGATHTENGRRRLAAHLAASTPEAAAASGDPGAAAVTVSGLLSGRQGPGRDADGALALDLLVVLDAPQLDLETAALLVESLTDGTRLVLSGDPGVLWSAGPGRLFADLLAARFCPQVASRTPDFGPIGELVSGIGIGELSQVEAPGKEVVIVPARDAGEAVHRTVQLVADSVPRALGVPAEQTQVITVGHGGAAGTRALNAALKERLSPGPGRFGGFDPGDRVAYAPAPGRTVPGTVTGADASGLHLDCDGTAAVVPREQVAAGAVRHGWALTAHQAAGMRWPAAVVVLPGDAAGGLTRAWVYTAFSRGERHLSVVQGVDQALPRAIAEVPVKERTTRLRTLLRDSVQSAEEPPAAG